MKVEPVLPQPPMDDAGPPLDNGEPRPTVTLRPLFTYLMIFDLLIGFLWGMLLFLVTNLAGAPTAGPGHRNGRASGAATHKRRRRPCLLRTRSTRADSAGGCPPIRSATASTSPGGERRGRRLLVVPTP